MARPKPYYARAGIELYHGGCLETMGGFAPGSFRSIVTDPPYGQSNEAYDRGVNSEVWRECLRVSTPNAALVSFAGSPTYHRIASGIEAAGWRVRQQWAWIYRTGFITSAWPTEGFDRLAPAMDPICFATHGKVILNLEREGDSEWDLSGRRKSPQAYSGRASSHGLAKGKGHWPRTVVATDGVAGLQYFALSRTSGRKASDGPRHPNEKPLALMEWIVAKLPGGPILDPFAGSGTTLIAALNLGKQAVGAEQNEAYCEIAARRIDAAIDERPHLKPTHAR